MLKKIHKMVPYVVTLSEFSHIFCCVLPTLLSIIGLLSGLGMVSAMPGGVIKIHDTLHHYELPMIAFSTAILTLGWGMEWYAHKFDCDNHHCHCDDPCKPKKDWNKIVLKIATALLFVNFLVYIGLHRTHFVQEHIFGLQKEVLQEHKHDQHAH